MKLYKFRALAEDEDFDRLETMLNGNCFWHSDFAGLNDPMEGSFSCPDAEVINRIYLQKNKYRICSFSGEKGFQEPTLWGHYANGFRGVAIEISIRKEKVLKINYGKSTPTIVRSKGTDKDTRMILTSKLVAWENEDEYRSLKRMESNYYHTIGGRVTAIYYGDPYEHALNRPSIVDKNEKLREFDRLKTKLIKAFPKIKHYSVKIADGRIVKGKRLT